MSPVDEQPPTHTVELIRPNERTETLRVRNDETIIEAADTADIGIPYGCLFGACGTCTARVVSGDLTHRNPPRALKNRALEEGYVLLCIATPETDCRLRVGHEIQAEVIGTPWK